MVGWECNNCGLRASDLPDGIDTDLYFEVIYGETYCDGCVQEYTYNAPSWGWGEEGESGEDDEDEGV